jgi:hypothetical protein
MRSHKVQSFELGPLKVAFDSAIPVTPTRLPEVPDDYDVERVNQELADYMDEGR